MDSTILIKFVLIFLAERLILEGPIFPRRDIALRMRIIKRKLDALPFLYLVSERIPAVLDHADL